MAAILVGLSYAALGVVFAALANPAESNQVRIAWRLAAWVISAAVFAAHLGHETLRLRNSAVSTALHVSLAVALGAFALALAAIVHAQIVHAEPALVRRLFLALALWPLITAIPAFVVALAMAAVIARARRGA